MQKFIFNVVVLVAVLLGIANGKSVVYTGSGQPMCQTSQELSIAIFRDNWDPTAYWKCVQLNEPAELLRCPDDTAFMDNVKDCVPWNEWQWVQPVAPNADYVDIQPASVE